MFELAEHWKTKVLIQEGVSYKVQFMLLFEVLLWPWKSYLYLNINLEIQICLVDEFSLLAKLLSSSETHAIFVSPKMRAFSSPTCGEAAQRLSSLHPLEDCVPLRTGPLTSAVEATWEVSLPFVCLGCLLIYLVISLTNRLNVDRVDLKCATRYISI